MDAKQFEIMMQTLTKALEVISKQNTGNITLVSNFENFNPTKEKFLQYKDRFENYLKLKNVFNDKSICAQLFLNSVGSQTYDLLSSLSTNKSLSDLSYNDLITLLDKYYPKDNEIIQQHKFLSRSQASNETISEYIATLQKLASSCGLHCSSCKSPISDLFLRAQFIRGLRDDSIREQLLQTKDLTFENAVQKSLAMEASKIDNQIFKDLSGSHSPPWPDINKLSRPFNNVKYQHTRNTHSTYKHSSSRYKHLDLSALGLNNLCLRCGKDNHTSKECKLDHSKLHCKHCNKKGHIAKVCITTLSEKSKNHIRNVDEHDQDDTSSFYGIGKVQVMDLFDTKTCDTDKFFTTVLIHGKAQQFEVDSGAAHTLIPKTSFERLRLPSNTLRDTPIKFRSYTNEVFSPIGVATVNVDYNGHSSTETLFVVPDSYSPLLGRTWIRHLHIHLTDIDNKPTNSNYINAISNNIDTLKAQITTKFSEIFTPKVGCIPNISHHLKLRPQSKPTFMKPRPIPYALFEQVGKDLDNLEQDGIITKTDTSDWGSPLVVVPKPDGSLRLCADYKNTVNPQLFDSHYPIPRIEETLHKLRNARYFCTLDMYKAYLHIPVDEESSKLQSISTHKGTYKVNRLSFGIKTAPNIFHQVLEHILDDLQGVSAYFDDIIIYGASLNECYTNLCLCLEKLQANKLHLNLRKCSFFQTKISYLGYDVEYNKISKSPSKVASLINTKRPKTVDEVRTFLGIVTYYSKFIPSASTLTYPLRQLLTKNKKFEWSKKCETAFINIKKEIVSDRVLTPFDPNLPVSLACDASPHGIAGVLSHIIDGIERPIAFTSRSLTKSESQYSQLDREALAIVYSVGKFFQYLYGRKFDLITDNQPLTRIFHPTNVPPMTAGRLLRYAIFLRGFEYTIRHRKSEDHKNVDFLSRSTNEETHNGVDKALNFEADAVEHFSITQISSVDITSESITSETRTDSEMKPLLKQLEEGTNDPTYSLNHGVIFRGDRVYVPNSLRKSVLEELHSTHIGIVRMKRLARRYCYWPGIDNQIEHIVRSCTACALNQKQPAKIYHPWEVPSENYERVHMDYAGPLNGNYFLIVVDAKSRWPEIRITRQDPTSTISIELLKDIFSTHGFPKVLVSDNATIFTSKDFQDFCKQNGIFQKFIAPGHPATNGLAERYVQTLKHSLRTCDEDSAPLSLAQKVRNILFRYRAVPLNCGRSPSELYLHRQIRTKLDTLYPLDTIYSRTTQKSVSRSFIAGERVLVRIKDNWELGKIINRLGDLHYTIILDNGYCGKKHIDQLKRTAVPEITNNKTTVTKTYHQKPTEVLIRHEHVEENIDDFDTRINDNQPPSVNSKYQCSSIIRKSTRPKKAPQRFQN